MKMPHTPNRKIKKKKKKKGKEDKEKGAVVVGAWLFLHTVHCLDH